MKKEQALQIIDKMQASINDNGINVEELVADFKEVRKFAIADENPRLVKCIRLTYEHLEEYGNFYIAQPEDEIIDEEGEVTGVIENENTEEKDSLMYLLDIMREARNKANAEELREYVVALKEYAENN